MPTYEYKCKTCGYTFEKFQGMNDDPLEKCPECGKQVKRLLGTGSGLILRGRGFHANDYPKSPAVSKTRCGKETTCCGREVPCDKPPCGN
jgi:putative FmdB family regulatory protein